MLKIFQQLGQTYQFVVNVKIFIKTEENHFIVANYWIRFVQYSLR